MYSGFSQNKLFLKIYRAKGENYIHIIFSVKILKINHFCLTNFANLIYVSQTDYVHVDNITDFLVSVRNSPQSLPKYTLELRIFTSCVCSQSFHGLKKNV